MDFTFIKISTRGTLTCPYTSIIPFSGGNFPFLNAPFERKQPKWRVFQSFSKSRKHFTKCDGRTTVLTYLKQTYYGKRIIKLWLICLHFLDCYQHVTCNNVMKDTVCKKSWFVNWIWKLVSAELCIRSLTLFYCLVFLIIIHVSSVVSYLPYLKFNILHNKLKKNTVITQINV